MRFFLSILLAAAFSCVVTPAHGQSADDAPGLAQQTRSGSYLGVGVVDIDAEHAKAVNLDSDHGAQVARVSDGSPAEKAGLKAGDVLLAYNGENILGARHLGRLVAETPPGRHVKIEYWRDGKVRTAIVAAGERPANLERSGSDLDRQMREFNEQLGRLRMSMPIDVPMPVLAWRNRALGIVCESLEPQMAEYFGVKDGVLVRSVDKDSPAERAGIRPGDVLTSVGDRRLTNPRDVTSCLRTQRASKAMPISLVRNHKPVNLSVTPAEYPQ